MDETTEAGDGNKDGRTRGGPGDAEGRRISHRKGRPLGTQAGRRMGGGEQVTGYNVDLKDT